MNLIATVFLTVVSLLYATTLCSQTAITARESILAYSATLVDSERTSLRLWGMEGDMLTGIGTNTWEASCLTITSEMTVRITRNEGMWKFDTVMINRLRKYETVRTMDLESWIDSDSLMNVSVDSNVRWGWFKGTVRENEPSRLRLYVHSSFDSAAWTCDIPPEPVIDPHFPGNEFRGGWIVINAITGKCAGVVEVTSVEEEVAQSEANASWSIGPNPVTDILHIIDSVGTVGAMSTIARIVSITGEQVITTSVVDSEQSIDVSTLPTGSYVLHYGNKVMLFEVVK